jgi:hypothetical protein
MRQILGIIIIGLILYYYFFYKEKQLEKSYKNIIYPKISKELNKTEHRKLTEFIFKIQLFYDYNPPAFEEMKQQIEDFIILYKGANVNYKYAGVFYELMIDKKALILNNLRSINIKIPKEYNINDALNDLEILLDEYLDNIYYMYQNYIQKNGYTYNTKLINKKEMAYNKYSENIGSFSYY